MIDNPELDEEMKIREQQLRDPIHRAIEHERIVMAKEFEKLALWPELLRIAEEYREMLIQQSLRQRVIEADMLDVVNRARAIGK